MQRKRRSLKTKKIRTKTRIKTRIKTQTKTRTKTRTKSNKARGPTQPIHCVMCNKQIDTSDGLAPAKCLAKYGANRAHQICQECWWTKFAKEGTNHSCPGCVKNLPLNGPPIDNSGVVDLTADD